MISINAATRALRPFTQTAAMSPISRNETPLGTTSEGFAPSELCVSRQSPHDIIQPNDMKVMDPFKKEKEAQSRLSISKGGKGLDIYSDLSSFKLDYSEGDSIRLNPVSKDNDKTKALWGGPNEKYLDIDIVCACPLDDSCHEDCSALEETYSDDHVAIIFGPEEDCPVLYEDLDVDDSTDASLVSFPDTDTVDSTLVAKIPKSRLRDLSEKTTRRRNIEEALRKFVIKA